MYEITNGLKLLSISLPLSLSLLSAQQDGSYLADLPERTNQMNRSPKRILVVDNDLDVLDSVEYNLQSAGYEVVTANSAQMAQKQLRECIIHLAIIDIRLEDEALREDQSGFEVARTLPKHIPCVIFTAYDNKENIRRALGEVGAKASLDKKDSDAASQLVDLVDQLFGSVVNVNFGLKIEGTVDLDRIVNQIEVPAAEDGLEPSDDDIGQILQSLFHNALSVHITPLLSPESAPTLTQAGTVLLRAHPRYQKGWGAPVVVKFSVQAEIAEEAKNYEHIRHYLGGQRVPVLRLGEGVAYSRQIGGLLYTLIGAQRWEGICHFADSFQQEESKSIIDLLERFFEQTFGSLFEDAKREMLNLTTEYTEALRLTPQKLRQAVEAFHAKALYEPTLRFGGLRGAFPNPILWALTEEKFRDFELVTRKCLVHGDLHSKNMLIDTEGNFWLIDFARVTESHALRDFAELETDIKFNLLSVVELKELLRFEQALLTNANFEEVELNISFNNHHLDHAYRIVQALRRIASELIQLEGDMREYYQALFWHTLNIMRLRHIKPAKKEHALLAAALLCQRLDNWPEWDNLPELSSPETITSAQNSLEEPSWYERLIGTALFLLFGTGIVVLLLWAMSYFMPSWPQIMMTFMLFSLFTIVAFALLGLITGQTAVEALLQMGDKLLARLGVNDSDS